MDRRRPPGRAAAGVSLILWGLPLVLAAGAQGSEGTAGHQQVTAVDSVLVDSPLPGGVAEVVRFLLNTVPPWMQIGGIVVGAILAVVLLRFLLARRRSIIDWVASRERRVKAALVVGVVVLGATSARLPRTLT